MEHAKEQRGQDVWMSVVAPVYNEEECLESVYHSLCRALEGLGRPWELVFVDDGSIDGSPSILDSMAARDHRVRVVRFRRNFGQTAALSAGFDYARGSVVVSMDSDGQNDPLDIPELLEKLEQGYDVVSGWRRRRKDSWLWRRVPSMAGNKLISMLTGVRLHDFGCTLKAYKSDIIAELALYGEMHRMIPVLAHLMGARITEVKVNHLPRPGGRSKYSINRALSVVLDLITLKFFLGYFTRPLHIFGLVGLIILLAGMGSFIATACMKMAQGVNMTGNPFLFLGVLCVIVGMQLLMLGLLGEVTIRTYFESQKKPVYVVKEVVEQR